MTSDQQDFDPGFVDNEDAYRALRRTMKVVVTEHTNSDEPYFEVQLLGTNESILLHDVTEDDVRTKCADRGLAISAFICD